MIPRIQRTFVVFRKHDASGVSGTGAVLEGTIFTSGRTVIQWLKPPRSMTFFESFAEFLDVHVISHPQNGTVIQFSDGEWLEQNADGEIVVTQRGFDAA